MTSNLKHYLGYGTALILLGLAIRFAVNEHIDKLLTEKEVQLQQKLIDTRDQAQKEADARIAAQLAALKTPQQAQTIIKPVFVPQPWDKNAPGTPVSVQKQDLSPQVQAQLPDAPQIKPDAPVMLLTPNQQVFAAKGILHCQQVEGDLSTCEADKEAKDKQISELQTALKGGNWVHRLGKELKCLGVGGLGAGLGVLVSPNHKVLGAMGGAVAGEAGCKILF